MARPQPVYLVDFSVYKPPEELKLNYPECQKASKKWKVRVVALVVVPIAHCLPRLAARASARARGRALPQRAY